MKLGPTPPVGRARELWLQHAAGYILFRDVHAAAMQQIDPALDTVARAAAAKAIDDAVYALMQVIDGVTGGLSDGERRVAVAMTVSLVDDGQTVASLNLFDGDGMCMGFHGWRDGDFGASPVVAEL